VTPGPGSAGVWDLPTRLFHWALVALAVFSYTTGKLGGEWMAWHMRSGYAILALLGFRLACGFAGPAPARFASFLRGSAGALAYLHALRAGDRRAPAAALLAASAAAVYWLVVVFPGS
jgi:cytochrome b